MEVGLDIGLDGTQLGLIVPSASDLFGITTIVQNMLDSVVETDSTRALHANRGAWAGGGGFGDSHDESFDGTFRKMVVGFDCSQIDFVKR